MLRKFRIFLWNIVSELEQRIYPYENEDRNDYYYTIKNPTTGEEYMIIEWLKTFDERIICLQEDMLWVRSEIDELYKLNKK